MIEAVLRNYLKTALDVDVYLDIPSEPGGCYIAIERTGGGRSNRVESATFAIQSCSAQSLYKAAELNERVKAAMEDMPDETGVFSARLNSDYNWTDAETKTYRYQAVYDIYY